MLGGQRTIVVPIGVAPLGACVTRQLSARHSVRTCRSVPCGHQHVATVPIGPFDTLLAGHARSAGLTLVTHNTNEFSRVPGLMTEDWVQPGL